MNRPGSRNRKNKKKIRGALAGAGIVALFLALMISFGKTAPENPMDRNRADASRMYLLSSTLDMDMDQLANIGNANINAKDLKFKNDNDEICVIYGDLKYGTKSEVTIPDKVVTGKVEVTDFVEHNENKVTFSKLVIGLFTLLVYVFAVVFLAKRYAPNAIEKLPSITVSHTFINLGIGLASFFIMFVLFVLLCISGIGVSLAFAFVAVFLFVCAIALPLFLNNIVNTLKFKANPYVKLLAVTGILYLISIIPVFGSAVMFVVMFISIGEVLFTVLNRKANK